MLDETKTKLRKSSIRRSTNWTRKKRNFARCAAICPVSKAQPKSGCSPVGVGRQPTPKNEFFARIRISTRSCRW